MKSNKFDISKIRYLDESGETVSITDVIKFSEPKNEFLGITSAASSLDHHSLIEYVDAPWINEVTSFSMFQSGVGGITSLDTKTPELDDLIILRIPKECSKLELLNSDSQVVEMIDFRDKSIKLNNISEVYKMVVMSNSKDPNYSVQLHENSNRPHAFMDDRSMTTTKYSQLVSRFNVESNVDIARGSLLGSEMLNEIPITDIKNLL